MRVPDHDLVLCLEPSPLEIAPEPCPREKGHEEEHLWYYVYRVSGKRHNVMVFDPLGERYAHMQYSEKPDPEDICVLIAFLDLQVEKRFGK